MKDFTELKPIYRARLDFPDGKSFISHSTFDSYEECFNYAKEQSKNFPLCGFCVVYFDEPQLDLSFNFGDFNA